MSKPEILLHACCATCAGYALEKISEEYTPVIFFYNPNIHPLAEYLHRRDELKAYAEKQNIPFIEEAYKPEEWYEQAKGLEYEPEKGKRCAICFHLRLKKAASFAKEKDIKFYTTTLTISPHKDSKTILRLGEEIGQNGVIFIPEDFKKQNGFKKTLDIAKRESFYRQNYCGCEFSRK